jgi:hypothetical protein
MQGFKKQGAPLRTPGKGRGVCVEHKSYITQWHIRHLPFHPVTSTQRDSSKMCRETYLDAEVTFLMQRVSRHEKNRSVYLDVVSGVTTAASSVCVCGGGGQAAWDMSLAHQASCCVCVGGGQRAGFVWCMCCSLRSSISGEFE